MVLVIDRDASVRELMRLVLAETGLDSVGAATPCPCLVRRYRPTLMIVELPDSSADASRHLIDTVRRDPALAELPILVSSTNPHLLKANRSWLDELRCYVLKKPFDIDDLLGCVALAYESGARMAECRAI